MHILFIADPLDSFTITKDSTFAMMREASRRAHTVSSCEVASLSWSLETGVQAYAQTITLTPGNVAANWYTAAPLRAVSLRAFDAVVMRKDPPFDSEYFYATHLLEQAQREGAKVWNNPAALRNHPEKLALMEFADLAPPTLVSRDPQQIKAFHAEHRDIILKPLDGMGGAGIFRIKEDALNLGAATEMLTDDGKRSIMVQRYLPAIQDGDKRILLIAGKPVPYVLARIPQAGEVRGNLAAGGKGVAQAISPSDLRIAQAVGVLLAQRGLLLVGLDVIGDKLTEINVTSPTCFQEITQQTGCDVAALFLDALEIAAQGQ